MNSVFFAAVAVLAIVAVGVPNGVGAINIGSGNTRTMGVAGHGEEAFATISPVSSSVDDRQANAVLDRIRLEAHTSIVGVHVHAMLRRVLCRPQSINVNYVYTTSVQ